MPLVAQMVENLPEMSDTWVQSLGREDPMEKGMATHSSIVAWRIHGQRRLKTCIPWGHQELDMTAQLMLSLFNGSVGKESACSAGDTGDMVCIPRSRKAPGGGKLQLTPVFLPGKSHGQRSLVGYSPWGRRVRHDWATSLSFFSYLVLFSSLLPHGLQFTRLLSPWDFPG